MCLFRVLEVHLQLAGDFGPNKPCLLLEADPQNELTASGIGRNWKHLTIRLEFNLVVWPFMRTAYYLCQ